MITPKHLKDLRTKHGLTQEQAANLVFKTKSCWCQYEKGKRTMDKGTYELLKIKLREDKL